MGSSAINAIAGSEMEREEFRLHVEDIRKAAEEAIENDEPIGEDFFQINGSDQNLVEDYEKLLDADGTLFEIFPEIETVKGTGSIELRVFLRIAEDGDPASYALTGEEELQVSESELAPNLQAMSVWLYHHDEEWRKVERRQDEDADIPQDIDHGVSIDSWIKDKLK